MKKSSINGNLCENLDKFLRIKLHQILLIMAGIFLFPSVYSQSKENLNDRIDSIINPMVKTNNYSGTILISKNNEILISKAYGKMSREYNLNNTSDTKFFLGSVSMIFTSAAIMKLHEDGKLMLSDPISKFIPGYKNGNEISINDLLSQRSGIPAIGTGGNVGYDSITKFEHSVEKLYSYFENYDLLFKPGVKYNHGRSDYILLAYIIENVTGKPFGKFLDEEIFTPLIMNNTSHYFNEREIINNLAKGYAPKELYEVESAYNIDWSSKTGHGSIYSTTEDLHKFAQATLNSDLLTKSSWDKIFTDYGDNVGYGWFISKHLNRDRYQMNGRAPGFSSYMGIYPEEKLTVIILSNNYVSLPAEIGRSIAALILNEPFKDLNLTREKLNSEFSRKLVGTYKFDENFYSPNYNLKITSENGSLFSDWGGLIPIDNGNKDFQEYILRTYWSSIEFIENEEGEISHMLFDNHKGIKIN